MHGFNLALALIGAFVAGAVMVGYLWWSVEPLRHDGINPFGILSEPPADALQAARDRMARDTRDNQERRQAMRNQARHDAERKPRDA